ncbi:MAG: capsule assembly Wzi family protein [Panacagrimonas sp.]
MFPPEIRMHCSSLGAAVWFVGALASILVSTTVAASAILLPAGNQTLRDDLNWLADRGVLTISASTWPLPLQGVADALANVSAEKLTGADAAAYQRLSATVARYSRTSATFTASANNDEYMLPRGFQTEARAKTEFGANVTFSGEIAALSLGVNSIDKLTNADEDQDVTADGSYAGIRFLGQIAAISQIDRWWGPSDQGSAILGSAARPFPAVSLQRGTQSAPETSWLQWVGAWNYHVLFGQLEDYESVPDTKLFGIRLSAKPFDVIEIGLSRTMQWGGDGRPHDFDSFLDGLLGDSNTDNRAEDPANQLAGVDLRINPFGHGVPLAVFAEVIGEDEAGGWPSRTFGTVGVEVRFSIGQLPLTWRVEGTETTADSYPGKDDDIPRYTYRNGAYPGGYYQQGLSLGYPIGGDGELYLSSVSAIDRRGIRYEAKFLRTLVNDTSQDVNLAYPARDKISAGILKLSAPLPFGSIDAVAAFQDSELFGSEPVASLQLTLDMQKIMRIGN